MNCAWLGAVALVLGWHTLLAEVPAERGSSDPLGFPSASVPIRDFTQLERTNLLRFVNANGQVKTVTSKRDWLKRRASILRGMQEVMGPLPGPAKRVALDVRIEEEVHCGNYVRRFISYASEPGARVPAYLLIPKACLQGRLKAPGVLGLHQTHREGQKVVVGLGGSPNDEYGVELVQRGFVVLAPPYPLLANYQPDLTALGYRSGTLKAVWDNMRGLDLLESLPFVKKGKFATIGHSLGGHNSIFTAVFDPRLKVIVTSCAFDSFVDYMDGNIKGWTSTRYMPALLNYPLSGLAFDFHELMGALAPRAVFVSAPLGDTNFKWASVDRIAASARQVYELHDARDKLTVVHPDCGHLFPKEIREQAYQVIERELK